MLEKLTSGKTFWLLFSALALFVYLPYIVNGGITMDGWVTVDASTFTSFRDSFNAWIRFVPHRPAYAAFSVFSGALFGAFSPGYNMLSIMSWLLTVWVTSLVLSTYLGKAASRLFVIFAAAPVIASSAVFHSAVMHELTISMLLWAMSLWLLVRYLENRKTKLILLSYTFVLLSLLLYEITLPLLTLNILVPAVHGFGQQKLKGLPSKIRPAIPHLLVIGSLVLAVAIYQKVLAPALFNVGVSNLMLQGMTLKRFAWSLGSWGYSLLFDFPIQLISSYFYARKVDMAIASLLIGALLFFTRREQSSKNSTTKGTPFIIMTGLGLLTCSFLFILSVSKPSTYGYANRTMLSTFLLMSILSSWLCATLLKRKLCGFICAIVAISLYSSLLAQRDNFIKVGQIVKAVLEDCSTKVIEQHVPLGASILANVPIYSDANFNNEEVFLGWWDFGFGIKYYTKGVINPLTSHVVNPVYLGDKEADYKQFLLNQTQSIRGNLWYYEFDQKTGSSRFERIPRTKDMSAFLKKIESSGINRQKQILSLQVKTWIKDNFRLRRDPVPLR